MTLINQSTISDYNEDIIEKNKKDKEYYNYILKHIECVKRAWETYFLPLLEENFIIESVSTSELKDAIRKAGENIQNHDGSKFGDDEFDSYRAKYYPTIKEKNADPDTKSIIEDEYEKAWDHHVKCNPHHPKHWIDPITGEKKDMTLEYIVEMICDWEGVSLYFNDNALRWYENDAIDEKECFTDNTRRIVDDILYNLIHK